MTRKTKKSKVASASLSGKKSYSAFYTNSGEHLALSCMYSIHPSNPNIYPAASSVKETVRRSLHQARVEKESRNHGEIAQQTFVRNLYAGIGFLKSQKGYYHGNVPETALSFPDCSAQRERHTDINTNLFFIFNPFAKQQVQSRRTKLWQ